MGELEIEQPITQAREETSDEDREYSYCTTLSCLRALFSFSSSRTRESSC